MNSVRFCICFRSRTIRSNNCEFCPVASCKCIFSNRFYTCRDLDPVQLCLILKCQIFYRSISGRNLYGTKICQNKLAEIRSDTGNGISITFFRKCNGSFRPRIHINSTAFFGCCPFWDLVNKSFGILCICDAIRILHNIRSHRGIRSSRKQHGHCQQHSHHLPDSLFLSCFFSELHIFSSL